MVDAQHPADRHPGARRSRRGRRPHRRRPGDRGGVGLAAPAAVGSGADRPAAGSAQRRARRGQVDVIIRMPGLPPAGRRPAGRRPAADRPGAGPMTAIPVQRSRSTEAVTVTDQGVEISHLRITHPETVAIARRELAEHGPAALVDTVTGAVVVGMVATGLQRGTGDTAAVMQRVLAGFDEAVQNRAAATVSQLDGLLGRVDATEQATREAVTATLAQLPAQIERGVTTALAGGAGDVREAVRQATATAQAEALTA